MTASFECAALSVRSFGVCFWRMVGLALFCFHIMIVTQRGSDQRSWMGRGCAFVLRIWYDTFERYDTTRRRSMIPSFRSFSFEAVLQSDLHLVTCNTILIDLEKSRSLSLTHCLQKHERLVSSFAYYCRFGKSEQSANDITLRPGA